MDFIKQNTELLQGIIDAPNIGLAVYKAVRNENGYITDFIHEYINRRILKALGQDFTGRWLSELGADGLKQIGPFRQVLETQQANNYILKVESAAAPGWYRFSNAPLPGDRLVHIWEDINDIKAAQQEVLRLKDEIAQTATDKYRTLFNSIDEGFAVIDLILDEHGTPVDTYHLEANPAYERHTGIHGIVGKRGLEVMPSIGEWLDFYGQIARTGETRRLEYYVDHIGRWLTCYVSRIGGEGSLRLAVVFNDITDRKKATEALRISEAKNHFLLQLGDALRLPAEPADIMSTAAELLGKHLSAGRVGYGEVISSGDGEPDATNTFLNVAGDWTNGSIASSAGMHRLSDFGEEMSKAFLSGDTIVIEDVLQASGHRNIPNKYEGEGAFRASLAVPLFIQGRVVAGMYIQQQTPRRWSDWEIALVREVTERTRQAVERARAEKALQNSEEKYRTLFNSIDEGVATMELILDDEGRITDWLYLEHNPGLARLMGLTQNIVGKKASDIYQNLEPFWMETFGRVVREGISERFEYNVPDPGNRWFDVYVARVGGPASRQIVVVYNDITGRKQQEQRQEFLLRLADTLRIHPQALEVEETVTRMTLEHFNAEWCYFVTVENKQAIVHCDARRGDVISVAGVYPLESFPLYQHVLDTGRPFIVEDVATTDVMEEGLKQICLSLGLVSSIQVPVVKKGVAAGILCLVQSTPRIWTEPEIGLAAETGERLWEAISRARTEEALKKSEEKYRTLFESMKEGFALGELIYDDTGRAVDWKFLELSPSLEKHTGMNVEASVNRPFREMFPGVDRSYWIGIFADVVNKKTVRTFENYWAPIDRWLGGTAMPAENNRYHVVFEDVTERRRREANLAFLAEISEMLVHLVDIDETMNIVSRRIADHFGLSACAFAELFDNARVGVIEHSWRRADMASLQGAYTTAEFVSPQILETCLKGEAVIIRDASSDPRTDGEQYAALNNGSLVCIPLVSNGQWRFLLVAYRAGPYDWREDQIELLKELTARVWARLERAQTDDLIRRSEQQLRELVKQREEFIGIASHELKTPVTSMKVYAELVHEKLKTIGIPKINDLMLRLNHQIDRLTRLINDLLDTTKVSEGRLVLTTELFNLNALLQDKLEELKYGSAHILSLAAGQLPLIRADRERIGQVIVNLLSNAIKYAPQGTAITVTSMEVDGIVTVSVEDEGPGISSADQEKIFEKFFRVMSNNMDTYPGMGLGLYISAQIVRRHNGTISVSSKPGKGSIFSFSLPIDK